MNNTMVLILLQVIVLSFFAVSSIVSTYKAIKDVTAKRKAEKEEASKFEIYPKRLMEGLPLEEVATGNKANDIDIKWILTCYSWGDGVEYELARGNKMYGAKDAARENVVKFNYFTKEDIREFTYIIFFPEQNYRKFLTEYNFEFNEIVEYQKRFENEEKYLCFSWVN